MEIYEKLRDTKAIPLWAQLRMTYKFATPEERATFDAMAKGAVKRGKIIQQACCPNDCTQFMNP